MKNNKSLKLYQSQAFIKKTGAKLELSLRAQKS